MKINNSIPLVPIIFAVSFILAHFLHNIGELSIDVLPTPIAVSIIFALLVFYISRIFLKEKQKSLAFSSIFIILFFFYSQIVSLLSSVSSLWFLPIWIFILFLIFIKIKRSNNLNKINQFFLFTSVIILLIPAVQIIYFQWRRTAPPAQINSLKIKKPAKISLSQYPDIYYIIPDSYSSSKSLQKYYGFDNTPFLNFLSEKDFYIASQAASNYPKTFLSLGSSFNMQYLDFLGVFQSSSDLTLVDPIIKDNLVVRYLKSIGYRYYQLGSWWGATHVSPLADKNILLENENLGGIGSLNYVILESTAVSPLLKYGLPKLAVGNSEDDKRNRLIYQFESLKNMPNLPGPKFVFAHIIAPHEPYVFRADCFPISLVQTLQFTEVVNYTNQLTCINKKLQSAITTILAKSKRPVVFIIQSDEGAPFLAERLSPPDNWAAAGDDLLREKFPVIEAIRMPNGTVSKPVLYPEISPVNIFRVIFNTYFQTGLPLLPDRQYIFAGVNNLYEFHDVTGIVKNEDIK